MTLATLVGVELRKTRAQKSQLLALFLPAIAAFLTGGGMRLLEGLQRVRKGTASDANGYTCLATAAGLGLFLGLLFLSVSAALSISGEVASGTMKTLATRPFRREGIVSGKALALLLQVAVVVALVAGAAWLSGRVFYGYADITDRQFKTYVFHDRARMDAEALKAFALAILPMGATVLFALLLSTLAPGPGAAVGLALGALFVFELVKGLARSAQQWLFAAYAPAVSDASYFHELKGFAQGLSDAGWSDRVLVLSLAVPAASLVLFWFAAALAFRRRKLL